MLNVPNGEVGNTKVGRQSDKLFKSRKLLKDEGGKMERQKEDELDCLHCCLIETLRLTTLTAAWKPGFTAGH